MLICGIKISHDGGVAVLDGDRLLFSTEVEKLDNELRYSSLGDLDRVARILKSEGVDPSDIGQFVVDGWFVPGVDDPEVRDPAVLADRGGAPLDISVAPYQDLPGTGDPLARYRFADHSFGPSSTGYTSYHHVSGHLAAGYCSSPFAARGEDALVLVWDGGSAPRLYLVEAAARSVTALAVLLPLTGDSFGEFSSFYDPFVKDTDGLSADEKMRHHLSIAGKAMAYAALGTTEESAFPVFDEITRTFTAASAENSRVLAAAIAERRDELLPGLSPADLIATFQAYLGSILLTSMSRLLTGDRDSRLAAWLSRNPRPNLVLAGGCALNIKWNSMLRGSGLFSDVWIPPFPNDSGAAIGTACCEMLRRGESLAMSWDVYSGPQLAAGGVPRDWTVRPCDERQLAELLHAEGEPVVVMSGRAELGPRALGNRSILAPATDPAMKDRLNTIKDRAWYRPVAPVCLTSRAAEVFSPGNADRYMLFEHRLRPSWAERLPAAVHLDGTARLQTIDPASGSATGRILACYEQVSGIPVLCNTSANFSGRGFFPDVASATRWGGTRYVWSDQRLYTAGK
ncbi:MAG TPA: carbamoyltransferase N-terminal domain-containing protein [Streptosporangiaceae bacterium]|nr:carbamoyltransferase N-terminal domain-containing protein [Streptosporangiaceae bacterium]